MYTVILVLYQRDEFLLAVFSDVFFAGGCRNGLLVVCDEHVRDSGHDSKTTGVAGDSHHQIICKKL